MNKFKMSIFVMTLLLLTSYALASCKDSKENEFKDVVSITYTVDGKEKTETSYASMALGRCEYISEDEYNSADPKYQVTSLGIKTVLTHSAKTVSSISGFDNSDKGKFIYYWEVSWGSMGFGKVKGKDYGVRYSKYEITSEIYYIYIRVKVVDDDTIVIIGPNGETTYNVSSYRMTYFNEDLKVS